MIPGQLEKVSAREISHKLSQPFTLRHFCHPQKNADDGRYLGSGRRTGFLCCTPLSTGFRTHAEGEKRGWGRDGADAGEALRAHVVRAR